MTDAWQDYKKILELPEKERHRAWLKRYSNKGLRYAISLYEKLQGEWEENYTDAKFDPRINLIERLSEEIVLECDGQPEQAKKSFDLLEKFIKKNCWGYIRSSHKGKTDYLWLQFFKSKEDETYKLFLEYIFVKSGAYKIPNAAIDLNFASSIRVFPVLFAPHRKHSQNIETPVYFREGKKIKISKKMKISFNIAHKILNRKTENIAQNVYQTAQSKIKKERSPTFNYCSLDEYKKIMHKWIFFEDETPIEVALATLIGEKIPGDPLWLFIIAPPGGTKTETLRPFTLSNDFFPLSDLTSKTFVSGLMLGIGKERRKIEDLLPQLDKKVLIFKDFTTVLEKSQEERQQIFAQLREIYDGSFAKKFGTVDKTVRYNSRFGLVAGVTPIVDKHWRLMQQLGERFLKIRWNEDLKKVTVRAREMEGQEKIMREELTNAAMGFITHLNLSPVPEFSDKDFGQTLDSLAQFVAIARTPISIQDYRTDFYFDYIPTPERPTRLVKQLKKMAKCLAIIRKQKAVGSSEIETLQRVCQDTIPQDRMSILRVIAEFQKSNLNGCPRTFLFQNVKMPETSILRVIEQLRLLDLIQVLTVQEQGAYAYNTPVFYYKTNAISDTVLSPLTFTAPHSKVQGVTREGKKIIDISIKNDTNPQKCVKCGSQDVRFTDGKVWYCRNCFYKEQKQ